MTSDVLPLPPRVRLAGVVVALVLGGAWVLESSAGLGTPLGPYEIGQAVGLTLCCLLALHLPFVAVVLVPLLVLVPTVLRSEVGGGGGAWLIALVMLVAHIGYRRDLRVGVAAYVVAASVPALALVIGGENPWEFIFFPLILAPGFGVGVLLRRERERSAELGRLARELAAERELNARSAVVEERARISRELHDAVAHTVSVMTLQVGVVRRRLAVAGMEGGPEHEALSAAEALGRQSVDELRRVVGMLREDDALELAPRASLEQLPALAEQVTATGVPVTVEVSGTARALPPALDMSAYRIVQEALSNTLRHGGEGVRAGVAVAWSADRLVLEVLDDGSPGSRVVEGGGHGLLGMRERVDMFGGELTAGPAPEGGFRVRAVLPLTGVTSAAPAAEGAEGKVEA